VDVISLGKATQALNAIKDLNDNIIAPLAEGRFPTVDERLDWLEAQATKAVAINSKSIDLSQGTFTDTEFFNNGVLQGAATDVALKKPITATVANSSAASAVDGNASTLWNAGSLHVTSAELVIDLGQTYSITKVNVVGTTLVGYDMHGSNDNINYRLIGSHKAGETIFAEPKVYRYIKVTNVDSGANWTNLGSIEVYSPGPAIQQGIRLTKIGEGQDATGAKVDVYKSSGTWESSVIDLGESWLGNKAITIADVSKAGGYVSTIPAMTSNTTPSGIITTSGDLSTTYAGWKAFDNLPSSNTWWTVYTPAAWIAYEFPTPKKITKYSIMSHAGQEAPGVFTFEGWDGSNWVILDSQNITSWINYTIKEFIIANPGSYIKYRINSTKSVSGGGATSIREVYMYESLPGLDAAYEVSYSDDGVSFTAYEKLNPSAPLSKRYLKFMIRLSSPAVDLPATVLDFNQSNAENRFALDDYSEANGMLGLKTRITGLMRDEGALASGKQFSYTIDRSKYKKITGIEV